MGLIDGYQACTEIPGWDGPDALTNDEEAFCTLYVNGFADGWDAAKKQIPLDAHHQALNALLADVSIDH